MFKSAVFLTVLLIACFANSETSFTVSGRQIYRNGVPFVIAGVDYSPVPAGAGSMDTTLDSLAQAHARDMPLLRNASVNAIRVYRMTADTKANVSTHLNFLDLCWNDGNQPVHVLVTVEVNLGWSYLFGVSPSSQGAFQIADGRWLRPDPSGASALSRGQTKLESDLRSLIQHYGNHSALMGFTIGNEINNYMVRHDPAFWRFIDRLHGIIKSLAPGKLTVTSEADDSMVTVRAATAITHPPSNARDMPNLDAWGINSYRGTKTTGFGSYYKDFAAITSKPLIFTEFGCPASTRDSSNKVVEMPDNAKAQGDYFVVHWSDMMNHRNVCAGGFVFAWSDGWWKHGTPLVHDAINNANPVFPGGWWDEEWFGINSIQPVGSVSTPWQQRSPDTLHQRDAYFRLQSMYRIATNSTD
jgi:hypothetical protein